MKPNLAVLVLAVWLAGCGGLFEAEAESERMCVAQTNLADVPAAPPVSAEFTLPVELRLDMGAAVPDLDEEGVEVDVHPQTLTLGSASGAVNFAGVETLTMTVLPPAGRTDLEPVVFRYERATPPPAEVFALPARAVTRTDLADYIQGDALRIGNVSMSGSAPQQPWTATLELCGATRVNVNYWDRITG